MGAVTFAVIVMVIAMVSRPEEIQLSIDRGYITVYEDYGSEVLPTATTSLAATLVRMNYIYIHTTSDFQ